MKTKNEQKLYSVADVRRSAPWFGHKINDCCNAYGISVATFRRYISFLRAYFSEMHGREIVYAAKMEIYMLK